MRIRASRWVHKQYDAPPHLVGADKATAMADGGYDTGHVITPHAFCVVVLFSPQRETAGSNVLVCQYEDTLLPIGGNKIEISRRKIAPFSGLFSRTLMCECVLSSHL